MSIYRCRFFTRRIKLLNVLWALVFPTLGILLPQVQVQAHSTSQAANSDGHITVIILDMSGSMDHNDHDGIRCSAVNAYIDMSGPGDEIGIIGLDGDDAHKGGVYNYQFAQLWSQPAPMDIKESREALKRSLAGKDGNCHPDQSTPTYDALNKALPMLMNATSGGKQGSVILLTDGLPYPDQSGQEQHIQSDLIPQFQAHNWPIDTIALGHDDNFSFLHRITDQTRGNFYADSSGVVSGESPLNIMPFFIRIFQVRNHRTPGPTLPPTTLQGEHFAHDFAIGDYVDHFDVIVVKETADLSITLTAPGGTTLTNTSTIPGVFVSSSDQHYVIFSVDAPQKGTWHINAGGRGQFLMDSLIVSSLSVTIVFPDGKQTVPLNQPFRIRAKLLSHGTQVGIDTVALQGTITQPGKEFLKVPFSKDARSGLYISPPLTMPASAVSGSYEIDVSASTVSSVPITQASLIVQFDQFPEPVFLSSSGQVVSSSATATVIEWDLVLKTLYALPLPGLAWLSEWPLQHIPAQPSAVIHGEVQLNGQSFTQASVTTVAMRAGSSTPISAQIINDGVGRFHVIFPTPVAGTYTVTFHTQGSFGGNSDIGTTAHAVNLSIVQATRAQEIQAWSITVLYLLLMILCILFIRFLILPSPKGTYSIDSAQVSFPLGRGNTLLQALLRRNLLRSQRALQMAGPGLQLLANYDRRGSVLVRRHGRGADHWFTLEEQPLKNTFAKVDGVLYSPSGKLDSTDGKRYRFVVPPRQNGPVPPLTTRAGRPQQRKPATPMMGRRPAPGKPATPIVGRRPAQQASNRSRPKRRI
jgi:hypothetical protein